MVIHGYASHTRFLNPYRSRALTCDDCSFHLLFLMYKPFGSQVEQMTGRLTGISPADDLLIEKHSSIQKRILFTANLNIAEILAGSPTRENYKDMLVSEGHLCGDCNFEVWYEYSVSEGGGQHL